MKRVFLPIVILLSSISLLDAQTRCGTDEAVDQLRAIDADYDTQMATWKNNISRIAQQSVQANGSRGQLYTVPIVFHIIMDTQAKINVVRNQIAQQLTTLNADFRSTNSNIGTVRSTFQSLIADVEVEFCLAVRDPNGNGTPGYTETITAHGTWDPNTEGDDMKSAANGGHSAWTPTKYINVWVVDLAGSQFGGVGGYAYIGGAGIHGQSVDGIVLDYQLGYGSNNRALSHEMGHYLGLYHVWGNAGGCNDDDGISDTPVTDDANFGCNYNTNTCNTGAGDLPDQIENHMDYSDCPAMFTTMQKNVMRTVLTGARSSLITNNLGCQGVNVVPAANFSASSTLVCQGSSISFVDNSLNLPTSWSWAFQGGTPATSTQQNPTVLYSSPGMFNVTLTATNSIGSDVETKTGYITVQSGSVGTVFSENFEGSFPGTWTISNPDNGITWQVVTVGGSTPGTKAARVNNFNYATVGQRDGLISPVINMSTVSLASLTFNYAHRRYSQNEHDSLIVYASINGGTSYPYKLYVNAEDNAAGANFATGNFTTVDFVPAASSEWCAASATGVTCPVINLNAFSGEANFRLKFEIYNDYGNNIYLDNVLLTGCTANAGAPVANFTASQTSACGSVSVNFTDQSTNNPTSWSWQFTGGNPAISTQQNPSVSYNTPGTFNVSLTISNANGSDSKTTNGYVTVYPTPSTVSSFTDASCPGVNNGSVDLTILGGTSPFNYSWSNGATSQDINGVGAGTYSATVTDAHNCTATRTVTVNVGSALQLSANVQDDTGAGNGSIALSVSNGSAPYSYQWSNGGTTATISGLSAGNYSVTVSDVSGCQVNGSYSVGNAGSPPVAGFSGNQTSGCGSVAVNFTDQSTNSPISWNWQFQGGTPSSSTQKNPSVSYNSPGSYTVTLTATNSIGSNTSMINGYINVYANPLATITKEDASCPGINDGAADLKIVGGSMPFSYLWSNSTTTEDLGGVAPGNYSVTVTDVNNCTSSASVVIGTSPALQLSANVLDDFNAAGVGSITTTVANGSAPYNYLWSNGATTSSINSLAAGIYSVTVTDGSGCQASGSYTVTSIVSVPSLASAQWAYSIYPNPVNDILNVSIEMQAESTLKLVLYNSIGMEVAKKDFVNSRIVATTFDMKELQDGVYFVRIESNENTVVSRVVRIAQ